MAIGTWSSSESAGGMFMHALLDIAADGTWIWYSALDAADFSPIGRGTWSVVGGRYTNTREAYFAVRIEGVGWATRDFAIVDANTMQGESQVFRR